MTVTDRFGRLWERWDGSVEDRSAIPGVLADARDEDLVELLAAGSAQDRKYERDVIATEVLNRLSRRRESLPVAAAEVLRSAEAAYDAAAEGQKAIHTAEGILKAQGDEQLGADVSASAYASLDTTRLAFEAAQQNSSDVKAAVSRSRIAGYHTQDSVDIAAKTSDATSAASEALHESGHGAEAGAAQDAANRIHSAARVARTAVRREQAAEEPSRER